MTIVQSIRSYKWLSWVAAVGTTLVGAANARAADSVDVTAHLEVLGSPLEKQYPDGERIYARNVWDLCVWNDALLVGGGNSSNAGPAQNAGLVPLFSYSPAKGQFRKVLTVDDEQIDVFRVLDGRLYVPGHDPREGWELGNFYRLEDNGWRKHRTIPSGIHNYDMACLDGTLFAALGTERGAAVAISRDSGATWKNVALGDSRVYGFLVVGGQLYSTGPFWSRSGIRRLQQNREQLPVPVRHYDGNNDFVPRDDLDSSRMFPGATLQDGVQTKIARSVSFKDAAAYLGAYCHNDHQYMPFGVFVADSLEPGNVSVRSIRFPDTRPWDVLVCQDTLYVLMDSPAEARDGHPPAGTTVRVAASRDGRRWTEVLHFSSKTFARSLAVLEGDFYFGLGCEVTRPDQWKPGELPPETGQILRVRKQFWQTGSMPGS